MASVTNQSSLGQDELLATLTKQGEQLDQERLETIRLLHSIAEEQFRSAEQIQALREERASIKDEAQTIRLQATNARIDQEVHDKICRIIGGFIVVGLIATGIVICVIRY
jgi:hypothetical protein